MLVRVSGNDVQWTLLHVPSSSSAHIIHTVGEEVGAVTIITLHMSFCLHSHKQTKKEMRITGSYWVIDIRCPVL
jgi:hypothetical protein